MLCKLASVFLYSFVLFNISAFNNFVLIAAPGSGKGTFSQYFVKNYDYMQICPGDIVRDEIKSKSVLGESIKEIVESGGYISEDIIQGIVLENIIMAIKANRPFIIDGFPRNLESLGFLYEILKSNNLINNTYFIKLNVLDEVCIERVTARKFCPKCLHVYNMKYARPKSDDICDFCNLLLDQRSRDTQESIKERLIYFHENIEPVMAKAIELSCLTRIIDTSMDIESLKKEYQKLLSVN